MNLDEFAKSAALGSKPPNLSPALCALWWDRKGDWDKAHSIAQDDKGQSGAWVHAYLHRVEGDASNAGYWYRRAGKSAGTGSLDAEWDAIAETLLREEGSA